MAVSVNIKADGVEQLKQRLAQRAERLNKVLDMKLLQLAEEAVTHAKENKGYKDRTANLKNSISYALYYNGELVRPYIGQIPKPEDSREGQAGVQSALDTFAQENGVVAPQGYSLIVVAGMNYGVYVEHKGYNVLHLTKYFLRDQMKKILEETMEEVDKGTL